MQWSVSSRKITSSTWSLSDAELYERHKAQMGRQKTQVMQKQICLQMYLLTASWQDLLFTILCKESECTHTRARSHTHTQGAELGLLGGWWLVELKIDRSHRRCRQMINSLWVVLSARWEAEKPLTLQDLSSLCDTVRAAVEWRGVEGLLVNFLLHCIHTGRAGWSWYWSHRCLWFLCRMWRAARQAEENSGFKSCNFLIKTLQSDRAKTRGKRKEGPGPGRLFQQAYNCG